MEPDELNVEAAEELQNQTPPTEEEESAEAPGGIPPEILEMVKNQNIDPATTIQQLIPEIDTEALNLSAGTWIEDNLSVPIGAFLSGRSLDEEAQWRIDKKAEYAEAVQDFQDNYTSDPLSEGIKAVSGGLMDAADSVTQFGELTGDTIKTGLNSLIGKPINPSQNPFHEDYISREIDWLDIPEEFKPENHTGLGKFARGLAEFGFLVRWTGGLGKASGVGNLPALRSANTAIAGNKYLKFLDKGTRIFAEGAVADLISSSSEAGNIANLAEEYVPWLAPDIMNALAVRPEDNSWLARIKTVTAGGGMNHVAHAVGAFSKGLWRYVDDIKAGKDIPTARENANKAYQDEVVAQIEADEVASTQMAAENFVEGKGISHADPRDEYLRKYLSEDEYTNYTNPAMSDVYRNQMDNVANTRGAGAGDAWDEMSYQSVSDAANPRELDPFVNPKSFDPSERATYRSEPNAIKKSVRESIANVKQGGDARSYTPIATESQIRAISRGNKSIRELVDKAANEITDAAFKDLDNRLDWADVKDVIIRQADPMINMLEDFVEGKGGNLARNFKKALNDPKNKRVYMDDGGKITTVSPTTKGANVLVLNALARTISDIADGAYHMSDKTNIIRQSEMAMDAMKVLLTENKKMGFMWSLDGHAQQHGFKLPKTFKAATEKQLAIVDEQYDEFFGSLRKLLAEGRHDERRALMELYELSDGKVRTLSHIHEYLRAKKWGGKMDDIHIKGRVRQELQGSFFNSILGAPRTIRKAILGTNSIAMLRPINTLIGARLPWTEIDEKQAWIAAAQIDSMGRAWAESWAMAVRNWKLGVARKNADYVGKFDLEKDLTEWKALRPFYEKFGTDAEKMSYNWMDRVVDFNTSPWVKYSINAMGAGDAFARTVIGRQFMAKKAAIAAFDKAGSNYKGSLDDFKKLVADTEEGFRKEIFDKNHDGFEIVKDKAAMMAGDEAAMTRGLQENFAGFEAISNIPPLKAFFPFVRTGFNYLDVVFQHTYFNKFRDKYKELVKDPNPSKLILDKYGIKNSDELAQEVALIEGRMAMGTGITGMATIAALSGNMTGDYPADKTDRDLWKLNKIPPNSFKVGGVWASYKELEIFAPLFSLVANTVYYSDVLGEKATEDMISKSMWIASSLLVEQSMLSGIGDLAKVIDKDLGSASQLETIVSKLTRAHFPGAALSATIGEITDGVMKESNTFWEDLIQRDAVARNFIPPKYDILSKDRSGKKLYYGPDNALLRLFNALSPVGLTPADDDIVKTTLKDIRYNLPEAVETIDGVELNSLERSELQKYLATSKDFRRDLEDVIDSKLFQTEYKAYKEKGLKISDGWDLHDARFYTMVDDVFRFHKARAKEHLILKFPHLSSRIKLVEAQKDILKGGINKNKGYLEETQELQKHGI